MKHEYVIYTSIPRGFDPEVTGSTLDEVVESCKGYASHTVPLTRDPTGIRLTLDQSLDEEYISGQLDDNFLHPGDGRDSVVLQIEEE